MGERKRLPCFIPFRKVSTARKLVSWILKVTFFHVCQTFPIEVRGKIRRLWPAGLSFPSVMCWNPGKLAWRWCRLHSWPVRYVTWPTPPQPLPASAALQEWGQAFPFFTAVCSDVLLRDAQQLMWAFLSISSTPESRLKCYTDIITGLTLHHP